LLRLCSAAILPQPVLVSFQAADATALPANSMRLTSVADENVFISTMTVPANSSFMILTCRDVLPAGVPFLVAFVPVDASALQTLMNSSAVANVMWNNRTATSFTDRLVLHPERYAMPATLPLQFTVCPALNTSVSSFVCALPPSMRGSLWRLYIGWGILFGPAQYAIPLDFPAAPLFVNQVPLTLTFPMPQLDSRSAKRFVLNKKVVPNVRAPINTPFDPTSPAAVSIFDANTVSDSGNQLSLNPVPEATEDLFFPGSMSLARSTADLQLFLRFEVSVCFHLFCCWSMFGVCRLLLFFFLYMFACAVTPTRIFYCLARLFKSRHRGFSCQPAQMLCWGKPQLLLSTYHLPCGTALR
jgi:hypothetical protein